MTITKPIGSQNVFGCCLDAVLETVTPFLVNKLLSRLMLSHSLTPFCVTAWHGAPKSTPHLPEHLTALEQCSLYQ